MELKLRVQQLCFSILSAGIVAGCASTPDLSAGNALPGIGLGASGTSILLSWDPESPIGRDLRPNTNLQLVASYDSPSGAVRGEPVSSVRIGSLYSAITFALPESLNNTATGPVCFQIVQNRRPVPVRIARPGESSAGFYYDEWVNVANTDRQLKTLQRDKVNIDQNVMNFEAGDPDFIEWQTNAGLASANDCDRLEVETNNVRPATALRGAAKITAAKQQCVALFSKLPDLRYRGKPSLTSTRPGLTPLSLAREIRGNIPDGNRMASVANALISDLTNHAPGRSYFEVAALPLNDNTARSLWDINEGQVTEANAIGLAEAYSGCISETENRIEQSYQSWQDGNDPSLKRQLNEARRAECRTRFQSFAAREERLEIWRARQRETDAKIAELEARSTGALPAEKPLIPEACPFS